MQTFQQVAYVMVWELKQVTVTSMLNYILARSVLNAGGDGVPC
jgi:hypothetical protein